MFVTSSVAKITTLNAADDLAGGAGTDTLSIIANGTTANTAPPLFLKEVEKVSVKDVDAANGTTLNLVNATGVTEVINDGSVAAVAFENIGTAAITVQKVATAQYPFSPPQMRSLCFFLPHAHPKGSSPKALPGCRNP